MSAPEFLGWIKFYEVEPWGLADQVLAALAGRHGPDETPAPSPERLERMFDRGLGIGRQTPEEMERVFRRSIGAR